MAERRFIPFVDLARQFRPLEDEFVRALRDIGRSGIYILGERLESFERAAAEYCGVAHAIGVGDGSAALFLSLKALGIGPGDEVLTAPNSFVATAWTIAATGARPVFADVAPDMNVDPERIAAAIGARTRAIVPVHLTGRPAAMAPINELAQRHGLHVVEDAAQAIGARYRGKRVGGLGSAGAFSLHPLKNLGVYGDGGLITTDDAELAGKLRKLRNHGLRNRDECEVWGYNSRLDPLQAAFAEIKLARLEQWNERLRQIAARYHDGLAGYCEIPVDLPHEEAVYHNFVIRTPQRDRLMTHLAARGVDTRVHYPIPLHLQVAARDLGYRVGDFPNAERYAQEMISLPIYPELDDEEVSWVVAQTAAFFTG
jgi:dTDP-4-amino-4,6-dideoxygalactose transaminase